MDELSAYAQRLRRAMTGPAPADGRFAGEPPDVARVSDSDLGTLLAVAWRTRHDREPAQPAAQRPCHAMRRAITFMPGSRWRR